MNRVLRPLTAFVMFAGVYAMAVVVGRVSRIAGSEVALVWPAAANRRHLVIDEADQRRVFELATVPLLQQPQLTALTAIARMRWNMCGCVQHSGVRVGPDQRYRRVVAE